MGCGKTSFGRKLAKRLGMQFLDTDRMVEEAEGAVMTDIFQYEGELHFRKTERAMLQQILATGTDKVISTGGGLPTWQDNMTLMNQAGRTIYLKRTAEQIAKRLTPYGRHRRPKLRNLEGDELLEFMTRDMAEREVFYNRAQIIANCKSQSDEMLLEWILEKLGTSE
ncbi:MAG: shikimate kinase [Alistipes sp.]